MRIRPARLDDARAMARVFVDSFHAAHRGQIPEHLLLTHTYEVSETGWRRTLTDLDPSEHLTVAESPAGAVLGICLCGAAADWEPLKALPAPVAECYALYVDPPHQGGGIGRGLLADASEALASKGFRSLAIGVLTANAPARAFYSRLGGQELGQRTHLDEGVALPESVYAWPDLSTLGQS